MPHNPLGVTGHVVDIETGQPLNLEKEVQAKRRLRKLSEHSQSLINDLSGNGGALVKEVMRLYVDRINKLIAADEECQAYEKLLSSVKHSVSVGNKIVADRARGLVDL